MQARRELKRNCPVACEGQIKDQHGFEQISIINQLDADYKTTVQKIINTMLTKKKFKDFIQQQLTMSGKAYKPIPIVA